MNKNAGIAQEVLEQVGGTKNIVSVIHCMTRLRFKLKDEKGVDLDEVKEINGVLGAQFAENSLHVIIGTTVSDVYKELIVISGLNMEEEVDENLDKNLINKKFSVKSALNKVLNTFASCMTPLIPIFVAMGMVNVIAALIGPSFLGLVSEESDIYNNFYYIFLCIQYFLPILVAISCAKVFDCSIMLSVTMVSMMLFPDMVSAIASDSGFLIYGINVPNISYSGQVIPAILVVWILSYVEKLCRKYIPDVLKVIGIPVSTLIVMLPLTFIVLGPMGTYIGNYLASFVVWLYNVAGPLESTIIAAVGVFMVAFGFGRPIFFATLSILMATGVEYTYMPSAIVYTNWTVIGVAAGYIMKSKSHNDKELGITCLVSSVLGGVSEPTIFGIILPNRKTFISCIVGGATAGLFSGIMNVGYYQFGPSNFLNVLGFMGGDSSSNFIYGSIAAGIAGVVSFVMMLITYKPKEKNKILDS